MPTRIGPCLVPLKARVKDAKSLFPPIMAYICAWQPAYVVSALGSSKIGVCEIYFFDILTTHNDHPSYVKHVLGCICVFTLPSSVQCMQNKYVASPLGAPQHFS